MKHKATGKAAFDAYYSQYFADQKWQQLQECLLYSQPPCLLIHHAHLSEVKALWAAAGLSWKPVEFFSSAVYWPSEAELGTELPGFERGWLYAMNPSSLAPVVAATVSDGKKVLDACAAPGGKSLALWNSSGGAATVIANDLSAARRTRMKDVFTQFGVETQIAVLGQPAETLFRNYYEQFDIVLCDAPCSSEAHIYTNEKELSNWFEGRVRRLSKRQLSMLLGLWYAVKPGGKLVYSTCALTPEENEAVVGAFLKKRKEATLTPVPNSVPGIAGLPGEYKTEFDLTAVRRIEPDAVHSPMFVAVFSKPD